MADREVTIVLKARDEATAKLQAATQRMGGGMFGGGGGVSAQLASRMSGLAGMGVGVGAGFGMFARYGSGLGVAAGALIAIQKVFSYAAKAAEDNAKALVEINVELRAYAKAMKRAMSGVEELPLTAVGKLHESREAELQKQADALAIEYAKAANNISVLAAEKVLDWLPDPLGWYKKLRPPQTQLGAIESKQEIVRQQQKAMKGPRELENRRAQIQKEKDDEKFHLTFMEAANLDRIAEERKGEEKRLSMVAEVTAARLDIMRDGKNKELAILTAGMNEELRKAEGTGVDKELIKQKYALKMAGVFGAQDAPNAEALRRLAPTFESRSLLNAPGATATRLADDTARIRALQDRGTRALEKIQARLDKGLSVEMAVEGLN